jgi:hypothetical protein
VNVVGTSDHFSPLFPDDFLEDIVGRMFVAWNRIPKPITEVLETRITKLLRHQYAYDPIIKQLPFQVRRELPIDDPATGEELGRIDLCLLHGNDEDVYFAFECKRLNVTFPSGKFESRAAQYVGPEGIGCFVSQKYASGQQHGGMIGYVFNGDIDTARSAINNQLAKSKTDLALLSNGLATCGISPENSQLKETQHIISGNALTIYHLLLPIV